MWIAKLASQQGVCVFRCAAPCCALFCFCEEELHTKRLLATILALVLTLSLLPMAWAEEDEESGNSDSTSIVGSGSCGENITWTLDSAGVLNVSAQ